MQSTIQIELLQPKGPSSSCHTDEPASSSMALYGDIVSVLSKASVSSRESSRRRWWPKMYSQTTGDKGERRRRVSNNSLSAEVPVVRYALQCYTRPAYTAACSEEAATVKYECRNKIHENG